MAKYSHDMVLDAPLDYIIANCNAMRVCDADANINTTGVPDFTKCTTAMGGGGGALTGNIAISGGDITKSDGAVSGRRLTVAAKNDVPLTASGSAQNIVLLDTTNSRVLLVTTCPSQTVTSGNSVSIPSWTDEFRDPS